MTTQKSTRTTNHEPANIYRFRHIDDDGEIYVGRAEITEDEPGCPDVNILDAWHYGTTNQEVYPYAVSFPVRLRKAMEQTALEQRITPTTTPIELPTDWDGIEILDVATRYILRHEGPPLPIVEKPFHRDLFGLKAIQDIYPNKDGYLVVIAKGGLEDVMSELHRLKNFS